MSKLDIDVKDSILLPKNDTHNTDDQNAKRNSKISKREERNSDYRNRIRKTLRGPRASRRGKSIIPWDESEDDMNQACSCVRRIKRKFNKNLKKFNEVSAANLKIRTGAEAGLWDRWGVYYCSNRYGRHSELNCNYFALASLFIMSQGSMLNLIHYMKEHGGLAFLVVLTLVYIAVGYPMYLFETIMGQYSGRKPLLMLRYMLPAFSGLGPALYIRTIVKAVNALGTFIYCAYLAFGLYFCKPTENVLIYRFLDAERRNRMFHLFIPDIKQSKNQIDTAGSDLYEYWWLFLLSVALFGLVAQNLKLYGQINAVLVRVLALAMCGYLLIGLSRSFGPDGKLVSMVLIPLKTTLKPNWNKLISGPAWLDAMIFVIQSMELGTLVHPYLGSKCFFHYRCHRDGIYLILLAVFWNVSAAIAALIWLGYVGVSVKEMHRATDHLFGHYGLFVVFMLKHLQAEMTGNVQGDVLFFNAFFYSIIGIAALAALVVYIIIIVDCSYPENGQLILKLIIMIVIVLIFGVVFPIFIMEEKGLRRLIFLNFYVHKSWSVFFIAGCYFGAVAFGHDMGKFVHDFLNIVHIQGYQSKQHSYHVPRTLRYFVLVYLGLGMICYIFTRPFPHEGQTKWDGMGKYIGIAFSCLPLLSVVTIVVYYKTKQTIKPFQPHRDWFKNKHHVSVCFADFADFKGIPALMDPDPVKKERKKSSRVPPPDVQTFVQKK